MDEDEIKVGARHNAGDQAAVQLAHDAIVNAGANCGMGMEKGLSEDEVVYYGQEIKAVKLEDGSVKLGGYLVGFSNADNTDLTGDYFTKDTDFGETNESDVYFNHRIPVEADGQSVEYKARLSRAKLVKDDYGIFAETILKARNKYEQMIIDAGLAGQLGWSSGTAGHLVDREQVGKAWFIKSWILGLDASLTPTPAEPRNTVTSLKSISVKQQVQAEQAEQEKPEAQAEPEIIQEVKNLGDIKMTLEIDEVKLQEIVEKASEEGYKKAILDTEAIKTAPGISVTHDEADTPFKSIGENLLAVKADFMTHGNSEKQFPRMRYIKATGASENVPSDGGFLLDPTLVNEIITPIHSADGFAGYCRRLPVGNNSNAGWINAVDETSRVTGSRWGGVRGYRMAEAATITASKPVFRRIAWELKKYAAVVVATDELLQDSAQFSAVVQQGVSEEMAFMLNDDIMNGLGISGAQGFMNSGSLVTVTRTTGSKILGEDISAMYNRMDLRGRASANWFIGNDSAPQLDNLFAVGSTAVLFPYASIGADGVKRLYGRPVITTEFNQTLNTTGDIVFADLSQYLLWEKAGVQSESSIHVYFLSDETAFRFVYRTDGKATVNTALTPYKGSTTTSPFVCLGSAT